MNPLNKSFKSNTTGEVVKIIDVYQNIAITNTKEKIDTNRLLDTKYYVEYIDPASFFNSESTYSTFAEKIKNVDFSKMPEDESISEGVSVNDVISPSNNDSAVILSTPEDEIEELKRKYGATLDNSSELNKQNEAFSKILNSEEEVQEVKVPTKTNNPIYEEVHRIEVDDPITSMFKSVKKTVDFSINIQISDKIPRLDFIEMMEDSYETSIIEFLANEMTNKILNDPNLIRNKILAEIKSKVYPKVEKSAKPVRKKSAKV